MIVGFLCYKLLHEGAAFLDAFYESTEPSSRVPDDCPIKSAEDGHLDHWNASGRSTPVTLAFSILLSGSLAAGADGSASSNGFVPATVGLLPT